jgi:signal transduction histidine kinase
MRVRGVRELLSWLKAHPMLRVWAVSIAVFTGVAVALALSEYISEAPMGLSNRFASLLALQLSDNLTYVPMTPLAYLVAARYPLQRERWGRRVLLLLAVGVAFTASHVLLRGFTPYSLWNPQLKHWERAITVSWAQGLQVHWSVLAHSLISNVPLDLIFVFPSIALVGHAVAYHQSFRQGELRKSQLESQLARARLEALRSQLQPHFLFNTLNSISSLMMTDTRAADRMMTLLSDLLRKSLASDASQLVSLAEELLFVDTYLAIETIRFEERLQVVRDIPVDTLDAQVPYLLLQPLIENAVRHGVARIASVGRIRIAARRTAQGLELCIADNGPGIPETGATRRGGLGLRMTEERLRNLYGDAYSLQIRESAEGGADVRLLIPPTAPLAYSAPAEA